MRTLTDPADQPDTGVSRRGLALGGAALALAGGSPAASAQPTSARPDIAQVIDPEYRVALPLLRQLPTAPLTRATLTERRNAPPLAPPLSQPAFVERTIPGPPGAPPVRVFVVNGGGGSEQRPAILHIHGGGFVIGTARGELRRSQELAVATGAVVVSVDYRLSPETPFPGPVDDGYAALTWLHANAAELGVDRTRIALYGGSAGGGLAAMLAIAARDRGEVPIVFQALFYPMLDDRTASTRKTASQLGLVVWRPEDNVFGWTSFLGRPAGSARPPYGSVPARVEDLKGLPPTWIAVGDLDLFVDEDLDYARRLVDAGVPTEMHVAPGAFHAFDVVPTRTPKLILGSLMTALTKAFAPAAA